MHVTVCSVIVNKYTKLFYNPLMQTEDKERTPSVTLTFEWQKKPYTSQLVIEFTLSPDEQVAYINIEAKV